jgi:hypothetical protein
MMSVINVTLRTESTACSGAALPAATPPGQESRTQPEAVTISDRNVT